MLAILRDLLRYNAEFRIGAVLIAASCVVLAALSFFSPYPPLDVYVVPPDLPPSARPIGSAPPRAARTCSGS